jgi:hypothetical protein
MNHLETLKDVAKLVKSKLPEKLTPTGQPKGDAMADASKLYTSKTKAEVIAALQTLAAANLITYRHDLRKVALTRAGLEILASQQAPAVASK